MQISEAIDTLSGVSQNEQKKIDAINLAVSILQETFEPQLTELDNVKHTLATQQVRAETAEANTSQEKSRADSAEAIVEQKDLIIDGQISQIEVLTSQKESLTIDLNSKREDLDLLTENFNSLNDKVTEVLNNPNLNVEQIRQQLASQIEEILPVEEVITP